MFYDFITVYTDILLTEREVQKISDFLQENIGVFEILTFKILTKR